MLISDDTLSLAGLVRADSRFHFRRRVPNLGHIATYNEGIAWASAEYMVLLSADHFLTPGALQGAVEFMDCHPSVGFTLDGAIALADGRMRALAVVPETVYEASIKSTTWADHLGIAEATSSHIETMAVHRLTSARH